MTDLIGAINRSDGQSTIVLERRFRTTPEDVWAAITDPERAARWLGRITGELRLGGHYLLVFDDADPEARVEGTIQSCEEPHTLVVTWQAPGESESVVHVALAAHAKGALLELTHSKLRPPASDTGHAAGWQIHLDQLVAGLERDQWQDQLGRYDDLHHSYQVRYPRT